MGSGKLVFLGVSTLGHTHAGMANSPDLRWVSTVGPQTPASNRGTRDLVPEGAFLGYARLQGEWVEIHKELWHWSKKQDKLNP